MAHGIPSPMVSGMSQASSLQKRRNLFDEHPGKSRIQMTTCLKSNFSRSPKKKAYRKQTDELKNG